MKLEQQVTSVEVSNKLRKLFDSFNVQKPSLFYRDWTGAKEDEVLSFIHGSMWGNEPSWCEDNIPCYTVAELGEMLPARLEYSREEHTTYRLAMEKQDTQWNVVFICADCGGRDFEPMLADTEADARAMCLIYLLENHIINAL